jgi:hypothetical protein
MLGKCSNIDVAHKAIIHLKVIEEKTDIDTVEMYMIA